MTYQKPNYTEDLRREQTTLDHGFATLVIPRKLSPRDVKRLTEWMGSILNMAEEEENAKPVRQEHPLAHVPLATLPRAAKN
jgi:hypothetical protein